MKSKLMYKLIKKLIVAAVMLNLFHCVSAQKRQILIADYENKPGTDGWWKDNPQVKFSYDERCQHDSSYLETMDICKSEVCRFAVRKLGNDKS